MHIVEQQNDGSGMRLECRDQYAGQCPGRPREQLVIRRRLHVGQLHVGATQGYQQARVQPMQVALAGVDRDPGNHMTALAQSAVQFGEQGGFAESRRRLEDRQARRLRHAQTIEQPLPLQQHHALAGRCYSR